MTAAAAGAAGVLAMVLWDDVTDDGPSTLVGQALAFDTFALFVTIAICAALILVAMTSDDYLRREAFDGPEVYALLLVAATGGIVMASANDLIVLFVGLETLSLAFYVLAASYRRKAGSAESGIKYFILGGFSSAFLLYGIALVYGAIGTTNISEMVAALSGSIPRRAQRRPRARRRRPAARRARLQGRRGAVPPLDARRLPGRTDAGHRLHGVGRQGRRVRRPAAGASSSACRSTATTGARPCGSSPSLSLVVGSFLAVVQTDVKRMLAYSSISHAGFILVGVEAAAPPGRRGRPRRSACRACSSTCWPTP